MCQIPQCLDPEARRVGNRAHLRIRENVLQQWDQCQADCWTLRLWISVFGSGLETFRRGLLQSQARYRGAALSYGV